MLTLLHNKFFTFDYFVYQFLLSDSFSIFTSIYECMTKPLVMLINVFVGTNKLINNVNRLTYIASWLLLVVLEIQNSIMIFYVLVIKKQFWPIPKIITAMPPIISCDNVPQNNYSDHYILCTI